MTGYKYKLKEVDKLTKTEYRKIIWGMLKDYRDDLQMPLVELLNKIMALPFPEKDKKKTILPCGNITKRKDLFKFRSENLGVFKKPEIERKEDKK
ncbi:hypothetical protein ES703_63253 [subsurface metagenome]